MVGMEALSIAVRTRGGTAEDIQKWSNNMSVSGKGTRRMLVTIPGPHGPHAVRLYIICFSAFI
jgi:hypothetical protein